MPKISIIVPVYNTEQYLRQCLDSIISQTFKDFECICVNDGSTDNSLSILQEYANKDTRFKIINKQNGGSSSARNAALKNVSGKYVAFVDADDFISSDYLEQLLNKAEGNDSDMVFCCHKIYYSSDNIYENDRNGEKIKELFDKYYKTKNTEKKIKYMLNIVEKSRSTCTKLYNAEIIKNNEIRFFEDVYAEVDYPFNILFFLYSDKINFVKEQLYCYRKQVPHSITSNQDKLRVNSLKSFMALTQELKKRNLLKNFKTLQRFINKGFFYRLGKNISYEQKKLLLPQISDHVKNLSNICKNDYYLKIKLNFYFFIIKTLKLQSFNVFRFLKNI